MAETPTFYQDIKPLFTQFDYVRMKSRVNLWDYETVKTEATNIHLALQPAHPPKPGGWSKIPGVHIMPLETGPWPQEQIDLFGTWIEAGCPEGTPPPVPPTPGPLVPLFLSLSQVLTGFEKLDILGDENVLAQVYIDTLQANTQTSAPFESLMGVLENGSVDDVLDANGKVTAAFKAHQDSLKTITILWYSSTIMGEAVKYIHGLQWRAIQAHPIGFANQVFPPFYWNYEPQPGGPVNYTGLISWDQNS